MEEFRLNYLIDNMYDAPVRKANYQLLVIPVSDDYQKVTELKIECSENQEPHFSKNIFGFDTISYYIGNPFTEFWFRLSATIQKQEINPYTVSPLMPHDEFEYLHSLTFQLEHHLFLAPTTLTTLSTTEINSFPAYTAEGQLFDYLSKLNIFIFKLLEYSPESTDVNTPIEEILKIRKGVCQDYAHLFISVCRLNKIPARYVSGYLNQGAGFTGASQLHAWAEVLIPELGWIGFDATNCLLADHHYIKIAHGTDFRDCSPIIGVLETTGLQKSIHSVTVSNQ